MEAQYSDERKPVPVITDISQRAIRERNPEDPLILPSENGSLDYDSTDRGQPRQARKKKDRYGNYASAIRKADPQSELEKRKQKYAAALDGTRIEQEDDLDEFYKGTGINPCEPDIMSTVPVDRIKKQYLSSAKEEGKVVPRTEEAPTPHHIEPEWPPREDMMDGPIKPKVIHISAEGEKHKRDGVDAGHIKPVNKMKDQWQNLPEKYRNKPLGVNKPTIDIVGDRKWITHFRPVIDEGKADEEPQWLKTVRHRRWLTTVRARFPEDEQERISFERRSTTPRKFKKPNPHTVMRPSFDADQEFEEVMRRRRKRSDSAEESSYLSKSASSFVKSASSFYSDSDVTDAGRISSLKRNAVKGPIKEYLRNLSLERSRNHMLKWAFTADVVDEPYRYDLPKPVDLIVMDELEREHQWKYEQAKQRFGSEEEDLEGTSMQSLSQVSFASEEDLPEKALPDESAGFIPKLTDIQQKLQDEVDSKPTPKSVAIEEDAKILPKLSDVKDKYLSGDETDSKKPFTYGDEEQFEGIKNVKNKLPKENKETDPQDYVMPTTVMKKDKDLKKMMEERKKHTDENVDDRAESAAQEIRSIASDISKTFGSEGPKESQDKAASKKEPVKKVSSEKKPEETKAAIKKTEDKKKHESTPAKQPVSSLDQKDSGKKKPDEKKSKSTHAPAKQEDKSKPLSLEEKPILDTRSTSK